MSWSWGRKNIIMPAVVSTKSSSIHTTYIQYHHDDEQLLQEMREPPLLERQLRGLDAFKIRITPRQKRPSHPTTNQGHKTAAAAHEGL